MSPSRDLGLRLAPSLLLLLPFLPAAGCGDRFGFRDYQPDAVATSESGAVIAPYGDERPARTPDDLRLAADLRGKLRPPAAVDARLPGGVEKPWTEPPRTDPAAWKESPGPPPVSPTAAPEPVPPEGSLAAGDLVEVLVERHPEFSGRWRVGREGFLTIPPGGAFGPELLSPDEFSRSVGRAAGSSPEDLAAGIARELKSYLARPPEVRVTAGPRRER